MNSDPESYLPNNESFASHAIHIGCEPGRWKHKDLVPPICLASTFEQTVFPGHEGFQYGSLGNPTRESLEVCLAKLEETKYCLTLPSGMAAATLVTQLLKKGDHVIAQADLYHGVLYMFKDLDYKTDEIEVSFVDTTEPENVKRVLRPSTKLVWLETPTNPLMKLVDLKAVTDIVKERNPSTIVVCDNTFLSPYFQRPTNFGVDVVMHSCTKYIAGHSDVLMGALCMNDEMVYANLHEKQILLGPVCSPFDCYLVIRSLKTLELRMERHMANALAVANFLHNHPVIEQVFHPGLPSHPQHKLLLRQCYGYSGMLSFYVRGHQLETTQKIVKKLRVIKLAESLGGPETTLKIPSQMPKGSLSEEEKKSQGITDGLFRLSVGLECVKDIIQDLQQALEAVI